LRVKLTALLRRLIWIKESRLAAKKGENGETGRAERDGDEEGNPTLIQPYFRVLFAGWWGFKPTGIDVNPPWRSKIMIAGRDLTMPQHST